MKRLLFVMCASLLWLGFTTSSSATLLVQSPQIVVDDQGTASLTDDLYFYRDLSRFSDKSYAQQLASIALLNTELSGLGPWADNWHLASSSEMSNLFSDFVSVPNVFLPSFGTTNYVGRFEDTPGPGAHYVYEVLIGSSPPISHEIYEVSDASAYPLLGAWATANYRGMPVPEPYSFALMVLGIAAISFTRTGRWVRI